MKAIPNSTEPATLEQLIYSAIKLQAYYKSGIRFPYYKLSDKGIENVVRACVHILDVELVRKFSEVGDGSDQAHKAREWDKLNAHILQEHESSDIYKLLDELR